MDNSTHNMSEKLIQYLDGELYGSEKISLEKELSADQKLKDELYSLKATCEAVKMFGLKQKVSGLHQQMMKERELPVRKMSSSRRIIRYSIAVAASVVLIAASIIGYNFYNLSPGKVFASNYHSYELSTVRDGDIAQVSPLEKAYRDKDYKKVAGLQELYYSIPVKETFLAGMAYVELGNQVKAIDALKKVIAENESARSNLFKDDAEYYLALTYVRNRDYDYALDLLKNIQENPEHLYHEKVTGKLVRQVRMLKWR